jgi:hypothetical protein
LTAHHHVELSAASIRIEGRLDPADRERDPYQLIPFDVPAGVGAIRVTFRHDPPGDAAHPTNGAVLDLGLIGAGSTAIGTNAFRGWSGSERSVVTVGQTRATPGYRTGSIDPGTWHAILGLYSVPAAGCRYRLDIELLDHEAAGAAAPIGEQTSATATVPSSLPAPGEGRWLACDLHAHSVHSDGVDDLIVLARAGRRAGLDVVVATDHNTDSHHPFLAPAGEIGEIIVLPGEELTTYGGHMNAVGATGWVDFRHRSSADVADAIDAVHRNGGLASINHPRGNSCSWEWGNVPTDLVEVWNGAWSDANEASLAWWYELVGTPQPPADRPIPVGGSDCHDASNAVRPLGTPTTWVHAATPTRDGIVDGLAAGRVALTTSPAAKPPRIQRDAEGIAWDLPARPRERLVVRSASGVLVERSLVNDDRGRIALEPTGRGPIPVAAEIRGPADALLALVSLLASGG